MWCLLLTTYFSRNGLKMRGVKPPKTMPSVAGRILGSRRDATRSAMTWAKIAPRIPARKPLDSNFRNRLMLQPK